MAPGHAPDNTPLTDGPADRCVPEVAAGEVRRAFIGLLGQGVVAFGGLLPVVALGRLAGPGELGVFALAASVALFATIATQTLFLSAYPIFRAQDRQQSVRLTSHAVFAGVASQLLLLPLYVAFLAFGDASISVGSIAAICAFVVTTVLRNFLRSLSLGRQDLVRALWLDSVAIALLVGFLVLANLRNDIDAPSVMLALAWSNAAFTLLWLVRYRNEMSFDISGACSHLLRSLTFGRWAFAVAGLTSAPYYLAPWFIMLFRGPEETAVFAAASTIVGIANHSFLGLTKGLEARTADAFAASGPSGLRTVLARTAWTVIPVLSIVALALFVFADFLGSLILPARAEDVALVVPVLAFALLAGSIRVLIGNGFWAMGRPEATLASALVRGISSVALGIAGAYYAGAFGCAVAVLAGDVLSSAFIARQYGAYTRARAT